VIALYSSRYMLVDYSRTHLISSSTAPVIQQFDNLSQKWRLFLDAHSLREPTLAHTAAQCNPGVGATSLVVAR